MTASIRPPRPITRYRREIAVLETLEAVFLRLASVYEVATMLHARLAEVEARDPDVDKAFIEAQLTLAMVCHMNAKSYLDAAMVEHGHAHPEEVPS